MAYDAEVAADSPWGYWKCEEVSGLPQDASGNARHATTFDFFAGGSPAQYGQPTVLLSELNGTSIKGDFARIFFPSLNLNNADFALECWLKVDTLAARCHLWINGETKFTHWFLEAYITSAGAIVLDYTNDALTTADGLIEVGGYYHIVFRRDHASDLSSIWLDGVKVAENNAGPLTGSSNALFFGGLTGYGDGMSQFFGRLAAYQSALSDARIEAHFDAGTGSPPVEYNWSVAAASDTEAAFSVEQDAAILEVRYEITTPADTAFTSPVYDQSDAGASRYLHTAGGLTASTAYLARIQVRLA